MCTGLKPHIKNPKDLTEWFIEANNSANADEHSDGNIKIDEALHNEANPAVATQTNVQNDTNNQYRTAWRGEGEGGEGGEGGRVSKRLSFEASVGATRTRSTPISHHAHGKGAFRTASHSGLHSMPKETYSSAHANTHNTKAAWLEFNKLYAVHGLPFNAQHIEECLQEASGSSPLHRSAPSLRPSVPPSSPSVPPSLRPSVLSLRPSVPPSSPSLPPSLLLHHTDTLFACSTK